MTARDVSDFMAEKPNRIITLMTDFGTRDGYVGAVKGVILDVFRQASIVDVAHDVAPHSIPAGAFCLATFVPWYPRGTIHVAVVDPGVGTARMPAVFCLDGQWVVAPDNGLVTLLWHRARAPRAFALTASNLQRTAVSATFHGRDVFAMAAARLASGAIEPEACGPAIEPSLLFWPVATTAPGRVEGQIIHVDRFGNLISSIRAEDLPEHAERLHLRAPGVPPVPVVTTYGELPPRSLCALMGSSGWLELAEVQGSAAERTALQVGESVWVEWDA